MFITDASRGEEERNVTDCKWTVRFPEEDENQETTDTIPEHGDWRCTQGHPMFVWHFNDLLVTHTHADC